MHASQEKILILLEKADKIPEIRNSIGVLSRYARFDLYSFTANGNESGIDHPELIALYSDDFDEVSRIRSQYGGANTLWVLVTSNISRESKNNFLNQGFISVVAPEASRKTLRKILTGLSRNISSVHKSKRVLLKNENQLQQLAGNIPDVYLEMERNGLIIDASPSCFHLLGIQPGKLIGHMLTDIGVSGREQIAVLNSIAKNQRYSSEIILKAKNDSLYRCSLIADTNMRSKKPAVAFYCLIRMVGPVDPAMQIIPTKTSSSHSHLIIEVRNGIVAQLSNDAENIFEASGIVGQKWNFLKIDIDIPENAFGRNQSETTSDLLALTDKQGEYRYFKIISEKPNHVGGIEYTLQDVSEILTHLRVRMVQLFEREEKTRQAISDEIRDDMGALISVGKMLIERIVGLDTPPSNPSDDEQGQISVFSLLERTYNKLKIISNEIYPSVIQQFGLESAMNQFVEKAINKLPCKLQLSCRPKAFRTHATTEIMIFRVFEESVQFASKAQAAEMSVSFEGRNDHVLLKINIFMNEEIRNTPENFEFFMQLKRSIEMKLFTFRGRLISDIINEKLFTFDFIIPI